MTAWGKFVMAGAMIGGVLGCSPDDNNRIPAPRVTQAATPDTPPASRPDNPPKASDAFKEGVTPKASSDPQQSDPAHTMTKQEESTAMPMAGQANDHSTLAKDPAKK
jgi:hypothetical protein